jgi:hypothetical protein
LGIGRGGVAVFTCCRGGLLGSFDGYFFSCYF